MFDKVGLGYLAAYLPGHLPAGQFEIFTELLQVKVPGTFPITPATSDTWPALIPLALGPPGVFEFTLRLQLAPGQQRSGASNRV